MTTNEFQEWYRSNPNLSLAEIRDTIATVDDIDPYTILGLINEVIKQNEEINKKLVIDIIGEIDTTVTNSITIPTGIITKDSLILKFTDKNTKEDCYVYRTYYDGTGDLINKSYMNYIGYNGLNLFVINYTESKEPTSLLTLSVKEDWNNDTKVFVNNEFVTRLDFESDPQTQINLIDNHIQDLDGTKADATSVEDLEKNKQAYFTYKYEGDFVVNDINDFRTKVYEQRKNPVRRWQFEINPNNVDLMSVLGYPAGFSTSEQGFLYIHIPYSEAGGFTINLELIKRNGMPVAKRTMASTLNSNWMDTDWYSNATVDEVNSLSMCPSNTIDTLPIPNNIVGPYSINLTQYITTNGYIYIYLGNASNVRGEIYSSGNEASLGTTTGYYDATKFIYMPVHKNQTIIFRVNNSCNAEKAVFIHAKEV